jgi:hypothetical protein
VRPPGSGRTPDAEGFGGTFAEMVIRVVCDLRTSTRAAAETLMTHVRGRDCGHGLGEIAARPG